MKQSVDDYNEVINQFKKDLELQKQIMKELQEMERPYLKKGKRGNTRNLYDEPKDLSEDKPLMKND